MKDAVSVDARLVPFTFKTLALVVITPLFVSVDPLTVTSTRLLEATVTLASTFIVLFSVLMATLPPSRLSVLVSAPAALVKFNGCPLAGKIDIVPPLVSIVA